VKNNVWVPLCSHIKRLIKAYVYYLKGNKSILADFSPFSAWTATFNKDSVLTAPLPPFIRDYVFNIRQRLSLLPMEHLHRTWGNKATHFYQIIQFPYWMQCEFKRLKSRKMKFFPIMKAQACHMRLDSSSLVYLYQTIVPQDWNIEEIKKLEKDIK